MVTATITKDGKKILAYDSVNNEWVGVEIYSQIAERARIEAQEEYSPAYGDPMDFMFEHVIEELPFIGMKDLKVKRTGVTNPKEQLIY